MKVEWTGWIAVAIVMYGFAIGAGVGAQFGVKKLGRGKVLRGIAFLLSTLAVAAGLNWLAYGMSSTPNYGIPAVQATEVAELGFGMKSGEAYPLVPGSLTGSTDIKVSGTRTSLDVDASSSSKLSLSFKSPDGAFYIVNIPTGPVRFITNEDPSKASVVLYLENPEGSHYDSGYGKKEVSNGPCTTGLQSGLLVCNRVREYKTVIPQSAKDAGLEAVVNKTLRRAVITLPCADFTTLREAKIVLAVKGCG